MASARLNDLQHKLQGVRYHRRNYEQHEDALIRQFETDHAPPAGAGLELHEPRLIYEIEGFLLQLKSTLDVLPQLLRSLGYRSMGESFGDYGVRVIRALDSAPRERVAAATALKEQLQDAQEWLQVVIDFRDEVAHRGMLEGLSCFRQSPYVGGPTAAIHYPEMPTGQRAREYLEQTEHRLHGFVDRFVRSALEPPKTEAAAEGCRRSARGGPLTMEAKAVRVTLKLREFFPPGDPLSVPLLTLMAATNDARQLQRLLIVARTAAEGASEANQSILSGEIGYLFRVLAGHLYEAGLIFRKLDELAGAEADRLLTGDVEATSALVRVRQVFLDTSPGGFFEGTLDRIRNKGAFHYNPAEMKAALNDHPEEADMLVTEFVGIGRYLVTDAFFNRILFKVVGWAAEEFQKAVVTAIDLAGDLGLIVDHLLLALVAERQSAIVARRETTVTLPSDLAAAYERRRSERESAPPAPP